ncbi:MAG: hypothetical protein R3330_00165 [Saprospiraceae bacterium]|nr:hypothetical protein [Saprospiraceae bacterium]
MNTARIWSVINSLALIIVLIVNGMANALPINGKTTGEISDSYPNLFTPAGFTFGIWGLIYLALLGFIIYQLVMAWKPNRNAVFITRIGPFFLVSCVANAAWIFAWHYEIIWLSWLIMLLLLGSLVLAYQRLEIGRSTVEPGRQWLVHVPFSLYLGWITIATIANTTILLTDLGWDAFGVDPRIWSIVVLWAGVSIAYRVWQVRRDLVFILTIGWAYSGIVMQRLDVSGGLSDTVAIGAAAGILLILIMAISQVVSGRDAAT